MIQVYASVHILKLESGLDFHIHDLQCVSCRRLHIPVVDSEDGTSAVGCVLKVVLKWSSRGGECKGCFYSYCWV